MKASIYNGTKYEISWSLDDTLTDPTLIRNIEDAGNEIDIDWKKNEFYSSIELLLEHYSKIELIEKLQDEDPEILEIIRLTLENPIAVNSPVLEDFIRLYLPVMLVIVNTF
ncbi:MAG: hypothetical protein ACPHQO_03475 [Candidatus Kariarchaeum pelagius]